MPPDKVGVNVGVTICKKSPAKSAVAITVGRLCGAVWGHRRVLFFK
jgi:hypothetical protein